MRLPYIAYETDKKPDIQLRILYHYLGTGYPIRRSCVIARNAAVVNCIIVKEPDIRLPDVVLLSKVRISGRYLSKS